MRLNVLEIDQGLIPMVMYIDPLIYNWKGQEAKWI
jgi:hypothetical protein